MKRFLRAILSFLERKFPDRLVVQQTDWNTLLEQAANLAIKIDAQALSQKVLEERVTKAEAAFAQMQVMLGLQTGRGTMQAVGLER